jgi:ABC-type dipeptide/oligopeptide/nickel transport system permease component
MAAATISAGLVVVGNLLADLALAWSDPRIRDA